MNEEMVEKMKDELKTLLEEERLAKMLDGETQITTSLKKNKKKNKEDDVAIDRSADIVTPLKNPSIKMSSRKK